MTLNFTSSDSPFLCIFAEAFFFAHMFSCFDSKWELWPREYKTTPETRWEWNHPQSRP